MENVEFIEVKIRQTRHSDLRAEQHAYRRFFLARLLLHLSVG
jgi:hypothetical protein